MSDSKRTCALVSTPTRRQVVAGVVVAFGGLSLGSAMSWAAAEEEISHTAESIHQEPIFKASRKRVYEALTDAKQFDKVVQLSTAMKSGMLAAAVIDQHPVQPRMVPQQLRDRRLDQQRDLGGRKQPAQRTQRRLAHDGIADPVGSPHEQPLY